MASKGTTCKAEPHQQGAIRRGSHFGREERAANTMGATVKAPYKGTIYGLYRAVVKGLLRCI